MDIAALTQIITRFAGKKVLVVGDMVLDEYIVGTPTRISREAPVLILEQREHFSIPGGGINPGINARTLGAEVYLSGLVGNDLSGERLRAKLAEFNIHCEGLCSEVGRPTSTKTRILAGSSQLVQQQIVRVDVIDGSRLGNGSQAQIIAYIEQTLPQMDAIIISDYENGVISPAIIETCVSLARQLNKIITVDSHGDLFRFRGVTAVTPNQPEAEATLKTTITDLASLEAAGGQLLAGTQAQGVLITRGSEGMSLFEAGKPPLHLPASNLTEVSDTTGAGDTVTATFTLALAAGAEMAQAAMLANIAASLVVRRLGNASNTPEELIRGVEDVLGERK
ncbi:MAG TPA: bifunctional ADP-heptose synthase [Ktedonobacterales bacterium]|nr:bifunctional ADP-heptose synthase [Ktedonobacterales bacterium]